MIDTVKSVTEGDSVSLKINVTETQTEIRSSGNSELT